MQNYKIILEDETILVVGKPAGLAVETRKPAEEDLESLLRKELSKRKSDQKGQPPYLAPINRLDQPVRGLVLFAKTKAAAAALSKDLNAGAVTKIYRATVFGSFEKKEGRLKDVLVKDPKTNTSKVVTEKDPLFREGKTAELLYKETAPGELEIELLTGRHHQIRVQLSNAGHPILGDMKYASALSKEESDQRGIKEIALTAWKLRFKHPVTGKITEVIYEE